MGIESLAVLQIDSGTYTGPLEEPERFGMGQVSQAPPYPEFDDQKDGLIRYFYIRISLILWILIN